MKTLLTALLVVLTPVLLFSQEEQYDLRFKVHETNCESNYILLDLEVKANDPSGTFNVAHQNYRFTFNPDAVTSPLIIDEMTITGLVQTNNPFSISFFSDHNLNGSIGNLVSYNVYLMGGTGYPLDASNWLSVGRLKFDIVDPDECLDLQWNTQNPEDFPNTKVIRKENAQFYPVDEGSYVTESSCLVDLCEVEEVPQYDMRFSNEYIDCDNDKYYVDLDLKGANAESDFNVAFLNLRFSYNDGAILSPSIDQSYNFSGFFSEGGLAGFYHPHTLTGSTGNLVSYNISLAGGSGAPVSEAGWTPVGRLEFDIVDYDQCMEFAWHDSNSWPNTIVIGKDAQGAFTQIEEGSYTEVVTCLPDQCEGKSAIVPLYDISIWPVPVKDYLAVSFGANQPKSASIVVYDTNGRVVKNKDYEVQKGRNKYLVNMMDAQAGVYSIVIRFEDYVYSEKFVKLTD